MIPVDTPYIAASPDGRVHDPNYSPSNGLVEFKNPYASRNMTIDEACKSKSFCLQKIENTYQLKRRHDYYFQVQCQLYCDNKQWCDFVVRTEKDMFTERILFDANWWEERTVLYNIA